MKIKILTLALITLSFSSFSQENNDSLKITQFNIKTSPLTIVDPLISSAQLALEYRHKHKYGVQGSYYFKTPSILSLVPGKKNEKLTEYKFEIRRYLQDELYLGLEYGSIDYSYKFFDDVISIESFDQEGKRNIITYNYDEADYRKTIQMINAKFGVQYNSRKHPRILFDFFFGVGVRRVNLDIDTKNIQRVTAVPQNSDKNSDSYKRSFGVEQPDGTYYIGLPGEDFQNNPPSNATDLGLNAQGVVIDEGIIKEVKRDTPAWDLAETDGFEWKGNFTFGIKVGYTLWSKYKY